jgi:hypothetical protein
LVLCVSWIQSALRCHKPLKIARLLELESL